MKTEEAFSGDPGSLAIHHLVVAVDASPASRRGLELAADLSRRRGARVTVVHVRHQPAGAGLDFGLAQGEVLAMLDEVEAEVRGLAAAVMGPRGIQWDMLVREGSPGVEVLGAVEDLEADMIVVGSNRHSSLHNLVLGSTTAYLTTHSPVPVLVARQHDDRPPVVHFRPRGARPVEPAIEELTSVQGT
jgi:nucleotide-binding universal stress UspA family protein